MKTEGIIFLFCILILFVTFIVSMYKRLSKKRFKIFILTIIILIPIIVTVLFYTNAYSQKVIWVKSAVIETKPGFSYEINHRRTLQTGYIEKFSTRVKKEELFSDLKKNFDVFKESDDWIKIIDNNEIYLIEYNSKNFLVSRYTLSTQEIVIRGMNDTVFSMPFPDDQIDGQESPIRNLKFKINCDFDYLLKFYQCYEGIKITDNQIQYSNITLTVEDSEVTIMIEYSE